MYEKCLRISINVWRLVAKKKKKEKGIKMYKTGPDAA